MLNRKRRTEQVRRAVEALLARTDSAEGFRPGDVNAVLRERNEPMGAWEVRGELSKLEREGYLLCDTATGRWWRAEQRQSA